MKKILIGAGIAAVAGLLVVSAGHLVSQEGDPTSGSRRADMATNYDSLDIAFLFEVLKITSYESTFEPIDGGRYIIAPILEYYELGERQLSIDYLTEIEQGFGQIPEEQRAMYLEAAFRHHVIDAEPRTLRTYVDMSDPMLHPINITSSGNTSTLMTGFDTATAGSMATMDFLFDGLRRDSAVPYFSVYAVDKETTFNPCPFGTPVDQMVQDYPYVWIISLEARSL